MTLWQVIAACSYAYAAANPPNDYAYNGWAFLTILIAAPYCVWATLCYGRSRHEPRN